MGMVLTATIVSPDEIERLRADPDTVENLLYPDEDDDDAGNVRTADLDKAWWGIHYLLTGSVDPVVPGAQKPRRGLFRRAPGPGVPAGAETQAVLGGDPIGPDVGYGPARLLGVDQVAAVAAALEPITPDLLAERVDLPAMTAADVYPQIWDEDDVYEEHLAPSYGALRDLYLRAAAEGSAVLLAVS